MFLFQIYIICFARQVVYDISEININITYLVVPFGKVVLATHKQIYNEP